MAGKVILSIILNIVWVAYLVVTLIIPAQREYVPNSTIDEVMGAALCEPYETMSRMRGTDNELLASLDIGVTPYCANLATRSRRDVSSNWIALSVGGTAFLFILATISELSLMYTLFINKLSGNTGKGTGFSLMGAPMSLNDKLQQLENARKAGTITYDEYDQMRSKLLREMSEK